MATADDGQLSEPRIPPSTSLADLLGLGVSITAQRVLHPRAFSLSLVFRHWIHRAAVRLDSNTLIIDFVVKKVLLVGNQDLSACILRQCPSRDGFSTGELKRRAMSFLAPRALTISDDDDWRRRRLYNEAVLDPVRLQQFAAQFGSHVSDAFEAPIGCVSDIRRAMGRAMLGIVFGGKASSGLVGDIEALFSLVQNPVKRMLTAPWAAWRRARFYDQLRRIWRGSGVTGKPDLVNWGRQSALELKEDELIEQIPHWMFTFTGSGTDLLTRTLALISSHPVAHQRALQEANAAAGEPTEAQWPFFEASLLEAARLYPPVTRTFHRAIMGAVVGNVVIPPGMEILHVFPPIDDGSASSFETVHNSHDGTPREFRPERWLQGELPGQTFDPFLGGARRCPGKSLVLFVCKVALAHMIGKQRLALDVAALRARPLPPEFPSRGLKIRRL
jgi:cytochrome P450